MTNDLKAIRDRMKVLRILEKEERLSRAYEKARAPRPPKKPVTSEGKNRYERRTKTKDPRMGLFKKGDLVQVSRLYLKRQRTSAVKKDESTKGIYYGPAKQGRYAYVDWFASEPWDHLHRQVIRIDYIEPLGTPR